MKIATTTGDFSKYADTYQERVRLIGEAGFKYIDIDFNNIDVFMGDDWKEKATELRKYAEGLGMSFVQAHSPCNGNPVVYDEKRDVLVATTKRAFEVCEILGVKNMVVHNGTRDGMNKKMFYEENKKFVAEFFGVMEKTGVNMCIENTTRLNMWGHSWFFIDGWEMREFIEQVGHPNLKACWDVGHANCEWHQYYDLVDLGDLLTAVHVHDNGGEHDEHALPFTGSTNFGEVIEGLIDAGYKGYFTFEATESLTSSSNHYLSRRPFARKVKLFETPLKLKCMAEKLLYEMGKYMLEEYDIFEE